MIVIRKSDKPEKRYVATVGDRAIHFGSRYDNFTIHKDDMRKKLYLDRHKKREDWTKEGIETPGFWSRWLLWNKPTLSSSAKNIEERFNVKVKLDT